jgi:uncharacterized iron-regulated protein
MAQDKAAYRIFDGKGKPATYQDLLKKVAKKDVVFFGELHNNPIAHWLQLELSQDLLQETDGKLILGAEMFERDDQLLLDEYLGGMIAQKNFEEEARIWNNYKTDYKPLVELAKANELPFIATNIPRRYANLVFREGITSLEQLSDEAKDYIAPLPIEVDLELESYQAMLNMMGGHGGGNEKFPQAQAVKDATMAYSIASNHQKKHIFVHYNGSYHSDKYQGIIWYLDKYAPKLKVSTIKTVEQEHLEALNEEEQGTADFIIVIPANMTKTY